MVSVILGINCLIGGGAERVMSTIYTNHPKNIDTKLLLYHGLIEYPIDRTNVIVLNKRSHGYNYLQSYVEKLKVYVPSGIHYISYVYKMKPDISVSFLDIPNIVNIIACLFTKTKCIVSLRGSPQYHPKGTFAFVRKFSIRFARNHSDMLIVNSNDIKDYLISEYSYPSEKIRCIYNPKNIPNILSKKEEKCDDDIFKTDEITILAAGRLNPEKGYVHLIRVLAELHKKYSCRLLICGKGELETELKTLTENLHIQDSVSFLGWQSNVYKYMNAADIFVMSSLAEGQPNSLIEALICGCPCVSVDCDYGPREILENGKYGLLSKKITKEVENPVTDPLTDEEQDLYDKLELMLTNKELRDEFRRKSVEVYDKFDEKIIVKKYFDTFLEGVQEKE